MHTCVYLESHREHVYVPKNIFIGEHQQDWVGLAKGMPLKVCPIRYIYI